MMMIMIMMMLLSKVKRLNDIAVLNNSSYSYEASLAIMRSHSVTCHLTQVNSPP